MAQGVERCSHLSFVSLPAHLPACSSSCLLISQYALLPVCSPPTLPIFLSVHLPQSMSEVVLHNEELARRQACSPSSLAISLPVHLPQSMSEVVLRNEELAQRSAAISEADWEEMRGEFEKRLGAAEKKVGGVSNHAANTICHACSTHVDTFDSRLSLALCFLHSSDRLFPKFAWLMPEV